jgi:hypothetical protein
MIKKVDVTSEKAFAYLKKHVNSSGKTLANYVELLLLENGKVYSFVPENTPEKELYYFEEGVLYPYDTNTFNNAIHQPDGSLLVPIQNDAESIVIDLIIDYLHSENHCCLIEEATAEPSDPWVKNSQIKYSFFKNEMYYFFNQEVNEKEFKEAFKTSQAWYFLCTLSVLSPEEQNNFNHYKELSVELIKSYIEGLKSFFVRAYDGEGYLQWESNQK